MRHQSSPINLLLLIIIYSIVQTFNTEINYNALILYTNFVRRRFFHIILFHRNGDRVIMTYVGLLENGTQFDRGQSEFVLGEKKVNHSYFFILLK
jgi:hypothetical protein